MNKEEAMEGESDEEFYKFETNYADPPRDNSPFRASTKQPS